MYVMYVIFSERINGGIGERISERIDGGIGESICEKIDGVISI